MRVFPKIGALEAICWLTALGVLSLIFLGGMVTTKNAGLAVPDWPLSFNSVNPPGWWDIEKVRLEHGHRLVGALIGILSIVCVIGTFVVTKLKSLRLLSVGVLLAVIIQGIMGGLRVTEVSTHLAITHGIFGQLVFCLIILLALMHSREARDRRSHPEQMMRSPYKTLGLSFFALVAGQLIIAATMRHYDWGMVIPDAPLAFGQLIPEINSLAVGLNYTHRVLAAVILAFAIAALIIVRLQPQLFHVMAGLLFFVCVQIALGLFTVWSGLASVPTTFHVTNGAIVLGASFVFMVKCVNALPKPARANSSARNNSSEEIETEPRQALPA